MSTNSNNTPISIPAEAVKNYPILQSVIRIIPDILFVKNSEFKYIAVSDSFARFIGRQSPDEIIGKTDFEIFSDPDVAQKHRTIDQQVLSTKINSIDAIETLPEREDQIKYISVSHYVVDDSNGNAYGVLGVIRDATQQILEKQNFVQELETLLSLSDNVNYSAFIDLDDWTVLREYPNLNLGFSASGTKDVGELIEISLGGISPDATEAYSFYSNFSREHISNIYQSGRRMLVMEYQRRMRNGSLQWLRDEIHLRINPINNHLCVIIVVNNVNEQKRRELELLRDAEFDSLTGLLNRSAVTRKIKEYLTGEGSNGTHALFMLDVDNFKKLNDTHGHQVGDRFLAEMGTAMSSCFRDEDVIGRLGGDEFFILMKDVRNRFITQKKATDLRKVIAKLCESYSIPELSVSIGISLYPADGDSLDDLYAAADKALYRAKSSGKNRYEFALHYN